MNRHIQVALLALVILAAGVIVACSGEAPAPTATPTPSSEHIYADGIIRWATVVGMELTTVAEQLQGLSNNPSEAKLRNIELSVGIWERLFFEPIEGTPPNKEIANSLNAARREFRTGIDHLELWLSGPYERLDDLDIAAVSIEVGASHARKAKEKAVGWKNRR